MPFLRRLLIPAFLLWLVLLHPLPTPAAEFQVTDAEEFYTALSQAEANGEDDVIIAAPGIYSLDAPLMYDSVEDHSLTLTCPAGGAVLDGQFKTPVAILASTGDGIILSMKGFTVRNGLNFMEAAGGVFMMTGSSPNSILSVEDCIFEKNVGVNFSMGALAMASNGPFSQVSRCTFKQNWCVVTGAGLYIYSDAGNVKITDNLFRNNSTVGGGSGVSLDSEADLVHLANNSFVENFSYFDGAGLLILQDTKPGEFYIYNNLFWANISSSYPEEDLAVYNGTNSGILSHNLFRTAYYEDPAYITEVATVSQNPRLDSAYRPQGLSPAWNAGLDSVVQDGELDLAGNRRIIGRAVDIGALEKPYDPQHDLAVLLSDRDGDLLFDSVEMRGCTDPDNPDTDGDWLSDGQEDANHNGVRDPGETDPCNPDTDGDSYSDGREVQAGSDPLDPGQTPWELKVPAQTQ